MAKIYNKTSTSITNDQKNITLDGIFVAHKYWSSRTQIENKDIIIINIFADNSFLALNRIKAKSNADIIEIP